MYQSLEKFPLRKINFVKTRTTILKAVTNLLKQQDFSDITVDEICQKAQISRGTFFNYFATKEHIFRYFLRIFTIRVALRMKQWDANFTFEEKMKDIYYWLREEKQYNRFIDNYIHFILNVGEENNDMKLIDAEFVYYFNNIEEDEYAYYNELTLPKLFTPLCEMAKEKNEIHLSLPAESLANILIGIITGTYITDAINNNQEHLELFNKIWQ